MTFVVDVKQVMNTGHTSRSYRHSYVRDLGCYRSSSRQDADDEAHCEAFAQGLYNRCQTEKLSDHCLTFVIGTLKEH